MQKKKKQTPKRLEERRRYVFDRISSRRNTLENEVSRIARDLFISERTVYRDYYGVD